MVAKLTDEIIAYGKELSNYLIDAINIATKEDWDNLK